MYLLINDFYSGVINRDSTTNTSFGRPTSGPNPPSPSIRLVYATFNFIDQNIQIIISTDEVIQE